MIAPQEAGKGRLPSQKVRSGSPSCFFLDAQGDRHHHQGGRWKREKELSSQDPHLLSSFNLTAGGKNVKKVWGGHQPLYPNRLTKEDDEWRYIHLRDLCSALFW